MAYTREGRIEADGSGHYADLLHEIYAEAGYSDRLRTAPYKRAVRMFGNEQEVCLVPTVIFAVIGQGFAKSADELIQSRPIDYVTGHFVSLAGSGVTVPDPSALDGKVVGAWSGLNVEAFMPKRDFTLLRAESEVTTIRMLTSGRVDVIWGWVPDSYILFERLGLGEPVLSDPYLSSSAHIVCKRTERSEKMMPHLNRAIDAMRADGRLKKILGKHSRIVGVDVPMSVANPQ